MSFTFQPDRGAGGGCDARCCMVRRDPDLDVFIPSELILLRHHSRHHVGTSPDGGGGSCVLEFEKVDIHVEPDPEVERPARLRVRLSERVRDKPGTPNLVVTLDSPATLTRPASSSTPLRPLRATIVVTYDAPNSCAQTRLFAAGVYFSEKCERSIPLPTGTAMAVKAHMKRHWKRPNRDNGSLRSWNCTTKELANKGHPRAPPVLSLPWWGRGRRPTSRSDDSIPLDGGSSLFPITGRHAHSGN
ncbi:hypothetical protein VTK26DRAFT_4411 [Humicola hyalothermophila]